MKQFKEGLTKKSPSLSKDRGKCKTTMLGILAQHIKIRGKYNE